MASQEHALPLWKRRAHGSALGLRAQQARLGLMVVLTLLLVASCVTPPIPASTPTVPLARLTLYVAATDGSLAAYTAGGGTRRWRFTTGGALVASPAVSESAVYVGSNDELVYALRGRDGAVIWRTAVGKMVVSTPVLVAGLVVVTTIDGMVIALDEHSGAPRWRRIPISACIPAAHAQSNQVIYYGTNCGLVLALRALDGATLWTRQPGAASTLVSTTPILAGNVLYVGIGQGTTEPGGAVAALWANDGHPLWRYDNSKAGYSRPAVGSDAIYASADNATVFALRRDSGQLLWTYGAAQTVISPPTLDPAGIYVAIGSSVVALTTRAGQPRWIQPLAGLAPAAPLVEDGLLFLTAGDRYTQTITARTTASGAIRWQASFPNNTALALAIGP